MFKNWFKRKPKYDVVLVTRFACHDHQSIIADNLSTRESASNILNMTASMLKPYAGRLKAQRQIESEWLYIYSGVTIVEGVKLA